MRPPRIPIPGIHKAGLQRRRNLYTSGNGFLIPDWIAGLSDLYDANREWRGYHICRCCMGPGRIDEGPSRPVSADGQGLPEGAADDSYLRGGREDTLMGSVVPQLVSWTVASQSREIPVEVVRHGRLEYSNYGQDAETD